MVDDYDPFDDLLGEDGLEDAAEAFLRENDPTYQDNKPQHHAGLSTSPDDARNQDLYDALHLHDSLGIRSNVINDFDAPAELIAANRIAEGGDDVVAAFKAAAQSALSKPFAPRYAPMDEAPASEHVAFMAQNAMGGSLDIQRVLTHLPDTSYWGERDEGSIGPRPDYTEPSFQESFREAEQWAPASQDLRGPDERMVQIFGSLTRGSSASHQQVLGIDLVDPDRGFDKKTAASMASFKTLAGRYLPEDIVESDLADMAKGVKGTATEQIYAQLDKTFSDGALANTAGAMTSLSEGQRPIGWLSAMPTMNEMRGKLTQSAQSQLLRKEAADWERDGSELKSEQRDALKAVSRSYRQSNEGGMSRSKNLGAREVAYRRDELATQMVDQASSSTVHSQPTDRESMHGFKVTTDVDEVINEALLQQGLSRNEVTPETELWGLPESLGGTEDVHPEAPSGPPTAPPMQPMRPKGSRPASPQTPSAAASEPVSTGDPAPSGPPEDAKSAYYRDNPRIVHVADNDTDEWLAERRRGVTSTNASGMANNKSSALKGKLSDYLGVEQESAKSPYIDAGHILEQKAADWYRSIEGNEKSFDPGLMAKADDPRQMSTPDLINPGGAGSGARTVEIKSRRDFLDTTNREDETAWMSYHGQMQHQMWVSGHSEGDLVQVKRGSPETGGLWETTPDSFRRNTIQANEEFQEMHRPKWEAMGRLGAALEDAGPADRDAVLSLLSEGTSEGILKAKEKIEKLSPGLTEDETIQSAFDTYGGDGGKGGGQGGGGFGPGSWRGIRGDFGQVMGRLSTLAGIVTSVAQAAGKLNTEHLSQSGTLAALDIDTMELNRRAYQLQTKTFVGRDEAINMATELVGARAGLQQGAPEQAVKWVQDTRGLITIDMIQDHADDPLAFAERFRENVEARDLSQQEAARLTKGLPGLSDTLKRREQHAGGVESWLNQQVAAFQVATNTLLNDPAELLMPTTVRAQPAQPVQVEVTVKVDQDGKLAVQSPRNTSNYKLWDESK